VWIKFGTGDAANRVARKFNEGTVQMSWPDRQVIRHQQDFIQPRTLAVSSYFDVVSSPSPVLGDNTKEPIQILDRKCDVTRLRLMILLALKTARSVSTNQMPPFRCHASTFTVSIALKIAACPRLRRADMVFRSNVVATKGLVLPYTP
jgi:hypothetical protein